MRNEGWGGLNTLLPIAISLKRNPFPFDDGETFNQILPSMGRTRHGQKKAFKMQ